MKKGGLREVSFDGDKPDEPHTITAHEDCIQIHFGKDFEEEILTLHPRHILAIVHMSQDWWDSHWSAVHEKEA